MIVARFAIPGPLALLGEAAASHGPVAGPQQLLESKERAWQLPVCCACGLRQGGPHLTGDDLGVHGNAGSLRKNAAKSKFGRIHNLQVELDICQSYWMVLLCGPAK